LPPLQDISQMAGFELPEYLGKMKSQAIDGSAEGKSIDPGTATELSPKNNKPGPQSH